METATASEFSGLPAEESCNAQPADLMNEDVRNWRCRVEVNGAAFYSADGGIVMETEERTMLVCPVDIEMKDRLVNPETGVAWYRIVVKSNPPHDILVPVAKGTAGIVKAIQNAGQFVRPKQLTLYLEEILAQNWHLLPVKNITKEETVDASPDAASVYELFLEFVRDNVEKFDAEAWGRIEENRGGGTVLITRPVIAMFLQKIGVQPEQWTHILGYWRENGLLHVDRDRKRFTKRERINGVLRRVYAISLPPDQQAVYEAI